MDRQEEKQRQEHKPILKEPGFVYRVLTVYGIGLFVAAILFLLWYATEVLLLVFASSLIAVVLFRASCYVEKWLHLPRHYALACVTVLIAMVLSLVGFILGPRIFEQLNQLLSTLPDSLEGVRSYLEQYPWLDRIVQNLPRPEEMIASASSVMTRVTTVFGGLLGALTNMLIVIFISLYMAARPETYIRGILMLLPIPKRARGRQVMHELGKTLEYWMLGKMLSMIVVGTVAAIGLWLLGVPMAITLGIIAGLFDFIPYIGPVLAGVPAVLIAFSEDPVLSIYVVLLFTGIQILEGYLLLPLVERRTVSLAPALNIAAQVLLGLAFGLLGVALAAPLVAAVSVLVIMLYVQDTLGDNVPTAAEEKERDS